jgi:ribosomal protein L11 methyltransferase
MEWRQFVINLGTTEPDRVEEVLCRHGAHAVTLSAAGDEQILEPAPGTTPHWENRIEPLADRAWEREWLKDFRPIRFGDRLWVSPAGFDVADDDAIVVRLDPGLAFGTGSHATTALCLEWLDRCHIEARTLLDFGCGSGILAIAGLKLGASSVTAVDNDLQAITATRQNALSNEVDDRLVTTMQIDQLDEQFDFVVANILAGTLVEQAEVICRHLKPGGGLALSGILAEQVAEVSAAYQHCVEFTAPTCRDDWACVSGTRI